jgi:hypothetical protein
VFAVKRCLSLAVLLILLTSCNREPPPYESHYVPPATTALAPASPTASAEPAPPAVPSTASFIDNFDRPDTTLGLGDGWDLRGNPLPESHDLPPANDGFIKDGRFTYSGVDAVAAMRQFRGSVRGMGAIGRFRTVHPGLIQSGVNMNILLGDRSDASTVVLYFARTGWNLRVRQPGTPFKTIAQGPFSPLLEMNRDYKFEFEATDNSVTVRVPGTEVTKDVSTVGLLGDRASWQQFPLRTPAAQAFDFDTVWATEDGQPLLPVPAAG